MARRRFLLTFFHASLVSAAQQNIAAYSGYSSQRECAKTCFQSTFISAGGVVIDTLGITLGCAPPTSLQYKELAQVDCYCKPDLQDSAHDFLTQCISGSSSGRGCGGTSGDTDLDAKTAIGIYDGYCASVRGPIASTTSKSPSTTAKTTTPTGTSNSGSPGGSSPPSNSEDKDKGGLSRSDIIAIAVTIPGTFLAALSVWIAWKTYKAGKLKKKKHPDNVGSNVSSQVPLQTYAPPQVNMGWNNAFGWGHQHQPQDPQNHGHVWR
ncbi:hypothetical protein QBC38DRAFT_172202 [Podospora fimiseda]|uniref:Uncharacterized protein n=1 Tax=Podospora fimiseda TaxID=252190 RepID=A0AAN7BCG5_9PEZI|nr:hypothetical protein QBC38DRAFT_172202 [Podospora fimiseda]